MSPPSVVPGYPEHLERIVLKALARDAEQRYATALQLQTDIEDFAHETRLRISPLVLARIMGTLFPTRLEEWDHAKAQGAFFVEQHVVRTLIESGKTPDPSDPETRAQVAAIAEAQARQDAAAKAAEAAMRSFGDDDPTALAKMNPSLNSSFDVSDTTVGDPIGEAGFDRSTEISAVPLPPTPTGEGVAYDAAPTSVQATAYDPVEYGDERVDVPAPPEPRPPQAYPIVGELATAMPGALVTASTRYGGPVLAPPQIDVTDRVRVPPRRHTSPTTFVRAPSRTPVLAIIGLLGAGAAIAAVIAFRTSHEESRPAPAETVEMPVQVQMQEQPQQAPVEVPQAPEPPPAAAIVEKPVEKPPVEKPPVEKPAAPKAAAKIVEKPAPKIVEKPAPKKPAPTPVAKKVEAKKPQPKKPAPKKAEPKETTWNADSPFMPVRTEKK